jgi:fumarate reductase subunit C
MGAWWLKSGYFIRYMIREGSALFLSAYALVLLCGLERLSEGAAAYSAWRVALAAPPAILFHCCALLFVGYHSFTWFQVLPKTMPQLRIAPRWLTAAGLAAAGGLTILIVAALWWGNK